MVALLRSKRCLVSNKINYLSISMTFMTSAAMDINLWGKNDLELKRPYF